MAVFLYNFDADRFRRKDEPDVYFFKKIKAVPGGRTRRRSDRPDTEHTARAYNRQDFFRRLCARSENEAKGYRTQNKIYEAALRKALGVADGEELGDIDNRISSREQAQQTALANALRQANDHLIEAAISSKEGYDKKLLSKIIDRSKL